MGSRFLIGKLIFNNFAKKNMKTTQANLINSFTLIILSFWGYIDTGSATAFIPFGFGLLIQTVIQRNRIIVSQWVQRNTPNMEPS